MVSQSSVESEFGSGPCAKKTEGHTASDALLQFCLLYKSFITWTQLTCQGEKFSF